MREHCTCVHREHCAECPNRPVMTMTQAELVALIRETVASYSGPQLDPIAKIGGSSSCNHRGAFVADIRGVRCAVCGALQ